MCWEYKHNEAKALTYFHSFRRYPNLTHHIIPHLVFELGPKHHLMHYWDEEAKRLLVANANQHLNNNLVIKALTTLSHFYPFLHVYSLEKFVTDSKKKSTIFSASRTFCILDMPFNSGMVVKNKQFHNRHICIGCGDQLQQHINEPLGPAILVSVEFYFIFQKLQHWFFFKEGDKCFIVIVLFLHITPFSLGVWTFV